MEAYSVAVIQGLWQDMALSMDVRIPMTEHWAEKMGIANTDNRLEWVPQIQSALAD
jgi:hypothetical protein